MPSALRVSSICFYWLVFVSSIALLIRLIILIISSKLQTLNNFKIFIMESILETTEIEQVIGKKFLKKKSILGDKERETLYIVEECNTEEFKGC